MLRALLNRYGDGDDDEERGGDEFERAQLGEGASKAERRALYQKALEPASERKTESER